MLELRKLLREPSDQFRFPPEIWVRVIYDFVLAYHARRVNHDHLLGALTPLYLGWVASYLMEMKSATAEEMEGRLEALCLAFEGQKPYLISRWRWPDGFAP
jgi:hypothetical protein